MKRTTRILTALALFFGAMTAASTSFAQVTQSYVRDNVRIESITVGTPATAPVTAGQTVTFDVLVKDTATSSPIRLAKAEYTGEEAQTPYLTLNIPFRGVSRAGVTTDTAVAYFSGSKADGNDLILTFTYTVRYGDLSSGLLWSGETPTFGGSVGGITLTCYKGTIPSNVALSPECLAPKTGETIGTPTGATPAVCGYDVKVGGVFDADGTSLDYFGPFDESLVRGVIPVTFSIPAGADVAVPASSSYARYFAVWAQNDAGQFLPVGVTASTDTLLKVAPTGEPVADFATASTAGYTAKASPLTAAGTSATYYFNVPDTLNGVTGPDATVTVGFGYGDNTPGDYGKASLVRTFPLEASPFDTESSYIVSGSLVESTVTFSNGTATVNGTEYPVSDNTLNGNAKVYIASLAANDSLSFRVYKSDLDKYADLGGYYAGWTRVSTANNRAAFDSPVVRFDGSASISVTVTAPETAAGASLFRLSAPGVANDVPVYLLVEVSVPRAEITLTSVGSTNGVEYVTMPVIDEGTDEVPAGTGNILKYTLTLKNPAAETTYFRVAPVFDDGTLVTETTMLQVGDNAAEQLNAFDMIREYATLSTTRGYAPNDTAACTLTVEKGKSTADFYVTLRNDFLMSRLPAGLRTPGDEASAKKLTRLAFAARTSTSAGAVIGVNDLSTQITPVVTNLAPVIVGHSAPADGAAANTSLTFSFNLQDAPSDYLVAEMNFGDNITEVKVMVDQDLMIKTLGATAWGRIVDDLAARYPYLNTAGAVTQDAAGNSILDETKTDVVISRTTALSSVAFRHSYGGTMANWSLTVTDSSGMPVTLNGTLTLATSQKFTAYTYDQATGGLGTVSWVNGTVATPWDFGTDYMYSGLARSPNTTVTVKATPYKAGEPDGYTEVTNSVTLDSFFYEWYAEEKFAGVLPTDDKRYRSTVVINRNYVGEGGAGDATDPQSWADIVISARFVREYLAGDYNGDNTVAAKWPSYTTEAPYILSLGDYNRDGVPDGWILNVFGEDGRDMVSGAALGDTGADGDLLPAMGWGAADAAYGSAVRTGTPAGNFALTGQPYSYALRLRGRDSALNAADGKGNWISHPQWVIAVRPEDPDHPGSVIAANLNTEQGTWTPVWSQIKLATSAYSPVTGVDIAFTENGIPYDANQVQEGWAVVVDAAGYPICKNQQNEYGRPVYQANTVRVCIDADDPDYEQIRTAYTKWRYRRNGEAQTIAIATQENDALYPYLTKAASDAATDGRLTTDFGGVRLTYSAPDTDTPDHIAETGVFEELNPQGFAYTDARTPSGILVDEPFYNRVNPATEEIDPRMTSWLERANASADQDNDGMTNGLEYFIWYYASRIAYAPVFSHDDGQDVQIVSAVYPAIDFRGRTQMNSGSAFVMGRRYRTAFDPWLDYGSGAGNNPYQQPVNRCEGNFWEGIPIADMMAAYHPLVASNAGATDVDNDGLGLAEELAAGTNPIDCDSDGDYMPDGWEVLMGTNPTKADGGENPDGDYFACTEVRLYPEYHRIYKNLSYNLSAAEEPVYVAVEYDREAGTVRQVGGETKAYNPDLVNPQQENVEYEYRRMEPKLVQLRDNEVYRAFGFNPHTGWIGSFASGGKFSAFSSENTLPFTNLEEFFSGLKRRREKGGTGKPEINLIAESSTSPVNADTNGDGVPDGWTAYVGGYSPNLGNVTSSLATAGDWDNLALADEFANRLLARLGSQNQLSDSMKALVSPLTDTWYNKLYPTDPWNPDTDFDGLWDADEGAAALCYGAAVNDESTVGGGCDPCAADTDHDGLSDGWEYRWFAGADTGAPDPTDPTDYDRDYDRDGLTNAQEYQTGFLRQLRYDLGPDAARMYAGNPGKRTWDEDAGRWVWKTVADLPSLYTVNDLANIGLMRSPTVFRKEDAGEALYVHALAYGMAVSRRPDQGDFPSPEEFRLGVVNPAVTVALNSRWNRTVLMPTEAEMTALGETSDPILYRSEEGIFALAEELDAVLARIAALDGAAAAASPEAATALGLVDALDTIIDRYSAAAYRGTWAEAWFGENGGFRTLWEKRRAVVLAQLAEAGLVTEAGIAPVGIANEQLLFKTGLNDGVEDLDPRETALDYETELAKAEMPFFVRNAYQEALRGFNGGFWAQPILTDTVTLQHEVAGRIEMGTRTAQNQAYSPVLAPVGYHAPFLGFEGGTEADGVTLLAAQKSGRKGLADAPLMGLNVLQDVGGRLPRTTLQSDSFITTSPWISDSDADGMDDYWEVFHGLNPVLGDSATSESEGNWPGNTGSVYSTDKVAQAYSGIVAGEGFYVNPKPESANPFMNAKLYSQNITGYNYYAYPWMAGVPFADPDGDGLTNAEEAVNGTAGDKGTRYGTDPSPLWMTDAANPHSFTARFYARLNAAASGIVYEGAEPASKPDSLGGALLTDGRRTVYGDSDAIPYVGGTSDSMPAALGSSVLPFEINEGYDTDGDGVCDTTELAHALVLNGDPQSIRTPARQQAAYLGGSGALQSFANTAFSPLALKTFTIECWVKPEADNAAETVLIDRPWRFDEGNVTAQLRYNFTLGLKADAGAYKPFVRYTSAGTTTESGQGAPVASPTVTTTSTIPADDWTHLAATYDGKALRLFVNGVEQASVVSGLEPGNGVISQHAFPTDDATLYTYRKAPILIGATAGAKWQADLSDLPAGTAVADVYTKCYKGFIDEVRIWNGARTGAQILAARGASLTEAELLENRLESFSERYAGRGFFQDVTVPELLAYYTFNDLPGGTKKTVEPDPEDPEGEPTAVAADVPWETYPGEKTVGGETVPGSLLYRRNGSSWAAYANASVAAAMPADRADIFASFYEAYPEAVKSTKYFTGTGRHEIVPMVHNRIAHLPAADVERDNAHLLVRVAHENGSPKLKFPSGSPANHKVSDSVYWSPYAAGALVGTTVQYPNVRTSADPYGYRYVATTDFDVALYREIDAFTYRQSNDLMVLGDVFAKYDFESWNNSPTSDPEAADPDAENDKPGADGNGLEWFEKSDGDGNTSKGNDWLENNVANGSTEDTDQDGMPSWWESYYGLDPEDPTGNNGPHGDNDGDFLTNYAEYLARSNPELYSTAGNGVPDYQIPIWARRGRPTFGLLYTDNDFMEDHWEALYRHAMLTVDRNDAAADPDGDGWSNYAELRATVRGVRGTDPLVSIAQTAPGLKAAYPTPVLLLEPAIFEKLPADATTKNIVVQAYTAVNNDSAPDATYVISLASGTGGETGATATQLVGSYALDQTVTGYLQPGNLVPGSLTFTGLRYIPVSNAGEGGWTDDSTWTMRDNGSGALCAAYSVPNPDAAEDATDDEAVIVSEMEVGTIDYLTGAYSFRFDSKLWSGKYEDGASLSGSSLRASYSYDTKAGLGSTFTLVTPTTGHLREGINNFFVFLDSNGDGQWNDGELAGVPDQHDVDVGWDKVTVPLRVTLTSLAPPGAVRVSLSDIANELWGADGEDVTEGEDTDGTTDTDSGTTGDDSEEGTVKPPMPEHLDYTLRLVASSALHVDSGLYGETPLGYDTVFEKPYNRNKPALTEDEIFAYRPEGLAGTISPNYVAVAYQVLLLPSTASGIPNKDAANYVVGTVTNYLSAIDAKKTALMMTSAGQFHNTDLVFSWKTNVQVPTFDLKITKTEDGAGNKVSETVVDRKGIRGVGPAVQHTDGTYEYRYRLPRGIGELSSQNKLFDNGLYTYTLTLRPYSGDPTALTDTFRIVLKESGRMTDGKPLLADAQDSYYVNLRVRYNGVLKDSADFGLSGRLVVEAHSSASFNGDPVAAVSDLLVYDDDGTEDAEYAAPLNPYVKMTKDMKTPVNPADPAADASFFSTCFDVELRGLPDRQPVYLVAYLDLNGNGRRDAWEPWGYHTVGKDAANGFYFDPQAVIPLKSGETFQAEFYIQDVDTDNDKLADAWEWKQNSFPATDFSVWHGNLTGSADNHISDGALWTLEGGLTALGAQLFGVDMATAEALGSDAADYAEILGSDLSILNGYDVYGLTVNSITLTPEGNLTLGWAMTADRVARDGSVAETVDLSQAVAGAATSEAVYTVYGKTGLGDAAWTKIGTVTVSSGATSAVLPAGQVGGNVFFKVLLTTEKKAVQTLAD